MKKRLLIILIILFVLAGLPLLLYPALSDYINALSHRQAIVKYQDVVQNLDTAEADAMLEAARVHNESLTGLPSLLNMSDAELEKYMGILDIDGSGIMGYIEIPSINVALPIFHGTSEEVLQVGVGHMEGSSFPVGGPGTHAVLSGHRGLPSAKLFTNLDRVVIGDTFTIRILHEVLTYQVDQIVVVEPWEVSALSIDRDTDYCTLVTCTPYGVNTHRMLVRGTRIETPDGPAATGNTAANQGGASSSGVITPEQQLILVCAIAGVALVVMLVIIVIACRRGRRRRRRYDAYYN